MTISYNPMKQDLRLVIRVPVKDLEIITIVTTFSPFPYSAFPIHHTNKEERVMVALFVAWNDLLFVTPREGMACRGSCILYLFGDSTCELKI